MSNQLTLSRFIAGLLFLLIFAFLPACKEAAQDRPGQGPEVYYLEPAESASYKIALFGSISTKEDQWSFGENDKPQTVKLNMADYPDLKALYFQADIASSDRGVPVSVRIYNHTDDQPIVGSEITNTWGATRSNNLIGFIPEKEIEISLQVRSTREGVPALIWTNSFLLASEE